MITKKAKLSTTFKDAIESNRILKVFKNKEYISKATKNCTKREFDSRLIENLKRIVEKNKKKLNKRVE